MGEYSCCNMKYDIYWVKGEENKNRICAFLKKVDDYMIPAISERVKLDDYAQKLAVCADTVFFENNGIDIASCSVYCNHREAFISSIAVDKKYFRRNIGSQLLDEVKSYIKKIGCTSLELSVSKHNFTAIAFYNKNGFQQVNENSDWKNMKLTF